MGRKTEFYAISEYKYSTVAYSMCRLYEIFRICEQFHARLIFHARLNIKIWRFARGYEVMGFKFWDAVSPEFSAPPSVKTESDVKSFLWCQNGEDLLCHYAKYGEAGTSLLVSGTATIYRRR